MTNKTDVNNIEKESHTLKEKGYYVAMNVWPQHSVHTNRKYCYICQVHMQCRGACMHEHLPAPHTPALLVSHLYQLPIHFHSNTFYINDMTKVTARDTKTSISSTT